jgi:RNA polymerase sigma-70 factor (ECF subfamily)
MENTNEKMLLKKAIKGSLDEFEILISPYQKKIYNIALNFTKNHDDALELSQEALIKVFRSIKTFNGDSKFSTWIYRITTNVCIDFYRKQNNITTIYIDEEKDAQDGLYKFELKSNIADPPASYLQKELRVHIKEVLNKIPIELKTIILLRDVQGFCYDEISAILNLPIGTVKSRLNRSRQLLKKILSKDKEQISYKDV